MTKQWLGSVNGPDWMDVSRRVKEIEAAHHVTVTLNIGFAGKYGQASFPFSFVVIDFDSGDLEGLLVQAISQEWPCNQHATFEACLHEALYRLDYAIGRSYEQRTLPLDLPLGS